MLSASVIRSVFVHLGFPDAAVHFDPVPDDVDFPHTHAPPTHTLESVPLQCAANVHLKLKNKNVSADKIVNITDLSKEAIYVSRR